MTTALFAVVLTLAASPPTACGWTQQRPVFRASDEPLPVAATVHGSKAQRDAIGTFPNIVTTTNFAVKWGDTSTLSTAAGEDLAQALEAAWAAFVNQMDYPPPDGSATWLVNVYIANTGAPSPSIPDGAGGWASLDSEGFPMIVLDPELVALYDQGSPDEPDYVAAHEAFHLSQMATGHFESNDRGWWFFEATAEWAASRLYPKSVLFLSSVGAYLAAPHLDVAIYDGASDAEFLHQYGAGLLAWYVDRVLGREDALRSTWIDGGASDPIAVLDTQLSANGDPGWKAELPRFAATNALMDYDEAQVLGAQVDDFLSYSGTEDRRVTEHVALADANEWRSAPAALAPGPFAYNVITLDVADGGSVRLEVDGPDTDAVVAWRAADGPHYEPLAVGGDGWLAGTAEVPAGTVHLVVSALPETPTWGSRFPFTYRASRERPDTNAPAGCACALSGAERRPDVLSLAVILLACLAFARFRDSMRRSTHFCGRNTLKLRPWATRRFRGGDVGEGCLAARLGEFEHRVVGRGVAGPLHAGGRGRDLLHPRRKSGAAAGRRCGTGSAPGGAAHVRRQSDQH